MNLVTMKYSKVNEHFPRNNACTVKLLCAARAKFEILFLVAHFLYSKNCTNRIMHKASNNTDFELSKIWYSFHLKIYNTVRWDSRKKIYFFGIDSKNITNEMSRSKQLSFVKFIFTEIWNWPLQNIPIQTDHEIYFPMLQVNHRLKHTMNLSILSNHKSIL